MKSPGESEWSLICLRAHQVLDKKQVEEKRVDMQGDLEYLFSLSSECAKPLYCWTVALLCQWLMTVARGDRYSVIV